MTEIKNHFSEDNSAEYPMLNRLRNHPQHLNVPETYFDSLPGLVFQNIQRTSSEKNSKEHSIKILKWMSIAAMAVGLIYGINALFFVTPEQKSLGHDPFQQHLTQSDVQSSSIKDSTTPDQQGFASLKTNEEYKSKDENPDQKTLHSDAMWDDLSAEELELYLIENDEF